MAETPEPSESIVKREPEAPARDPIVSRSTSAIMLVSALLMIASLAWALWDESYGQRPWKGIQQQFVKRYTTYLKSIRNDAGRSEAEVKQSPDYQDFDEAAKAAREKTTPREKEIDAEVTKVQAKLDAVTDPFQNQRGKIVVTIYELETANSDSARRNKENQVAAQKAQPVEVDMPAEDGSGKVVRQKIKFPELEKLYNDLREAKAKLLSEKAELLKEPMQLAKKRDDYLKNHVSSLTASQVDSLIAKNEKFNYSIQGHQINVNQFSVVDRCEICHLGVREPVTLKAEFLAPDGPGKKPDNLARAFVSHPNKELLQIHNPDKFGCSSCHWGNGRATTSIEKGHGRHRFWLHPMFRTENAQAGCQQCHSNDRVIQGAEVLNLGKDLFSERGCVGCHRAAGFDREADALSGTRQEISQLEEQIAANERQATQEENADVSDDVELQRLKAHAEALRVTNSQLAARIDQLNVQTRFMMQDQKKIGPNLKDVRLKLKKEWIPVWLEDPQGFRPGTKMPTFWRFAKSDSHENHSGVPRDENADQQIQAISAYLWQEGFDGKVPTQQQGNLTNGKELFETRGCLACHSVGEEGNKTGGDFAANLQRVGEKANFDYIVRWIYNPRERWAPYCPKEKRDLTREDYDKHKLPFVFDTEMHSKCPNDGAELQVQNMTVMPNFRLSESEARDIATYLFSLSGQSSYAQASFMDDPNLKAEGFKQIKQYGCAGCHEIRGFEEEQRIGKELTTEGATPIERLDFALLTQDAEHGHDPLFEKNKEPWYDRRGFFEHKLAEPAIYDRGKKKDPGDRLRMPKPYLTDEWRTALTTFLLGSVGAEGANVPAALFYNPQDQRRQDIQNGWWVIKKYNCMGCHNVQVGQRSTLMDLPLYQGEEQLPPRLTSEGARVDPNWLLRFLHDPSLSDQRSPAAPAPTPIMAVPTPAATPAAATGPEAQAANGETGKKTATGGAFKPQPGANRNGVRPYLQVRMPTFNFSPNELQILVRFFMAVSSQQQPYIKEELEPLSAQELLVARQMFTSGIPCLRCHVTGDPIRDKRANAPNFLLAGERLKPDWTYRWLLDPAQISPNTAMPSGLFKKEGDHWVINLPNPPSGVTDYHKDHARLLVRYMFMLTPDEQRRLLSTSPAPAASAPATTPSSEQKVGRHSVGSSGRRVLAWNARPRAYKLASSYGQDYIGP